MALYLLDSDAVIDYLNNIPRSVNLIDGVASRGDTLCTCDLITAEVYAGMSPDDEQRWARLVNSFDFLISTKALAEQAGRWRYSYRRLGIQIPVQDALIAATAMAYNATLVTGNVRHFPMRELSLLPLPR